MEAYGRHHPELVENDGPDAVLITSRGSSKDCRMLLRGEGVAAAQGALAAEAAAAGGL